MTDKPTPDALPDCAYPQPRTAEPVPAGTQQVHCPECGKAFIKRARNQRYCSQACNHAARDPSRKRGNAPPNTRRCTWCDGEFTPDRKTQDFCSDRCRHAFANFWKGKAVQMATALLNWRFARQPGAFSRLCQTISDLRRQMLDAKAAAKKGE